MEAQFRVGQLVCLRADTSRTGPIMELLQLAGGIPRYRVFHSPQEIRDYDEDQLVPLDVGSSPDDMSGALSRGQWIDAETFRARLTAARLSHRLIDSLYSLHAARIRYIPFQFKPLLRLLRADQPRLLIADEVGVGKTIEAGLVLKELETRQHLDTVLIVCPKALVTKWRMEMRRFDEDFRALSAEDLRYCLKETHLDGEWPVQYRRAIVHLELLRSDAYLQGDTGRAGRPGLLTLNPPPRFDLLIVDEAHHVRNPGTRSHDLARYLCDTSEAALFLSATPVQLGSRNLYALLNLLRPDLFASESVLDEMLEPARDITEALRWVRAGVVGSDTWQVEARQALQRATATNWGQLVLSRDSDLQTWQRRLSAREVQTPEERIRCLRDLEEMHPLAHIMNRTRRRDIGRFTLREPHTVVVQFTPEQQRFYEAVIAYRQDVLAMHYDPQLVRMITDTLERQAANCLFGLVPMLDAFLRHGTFSIAELTDDVDIEEVPSEVPAHLVNRARELRALAAALPAEDPKFDQLLAIARSALDGTGPRKVLVFSYFLHTLRYLEQRLRAVGLRVGMVTGKVPDEERERLRERFRLAAEDSEALDVLLSSEVGCEGLDYEFCDRLVNYDIPWNPMRIEQRIGRLDRFGQAADKILIFNFITPGTVEERVFFRCFERLDIFRTTIGDLEEILGDVVQSLTQTAFDPTLTLEQAEARARQTADNALRLIEERQRLEDESGALVGLNQLMDNELETLVADGRYVSPQDLRVMVEAFLSSPELGGRLTTDPQHPGCSTLRLRKEGREALLAQVRSVDAVGRPLRELTRWLEGSDPHLTVTFDQETAVECREVPFITPVHPLAQLAIHHWQRRTEPLVSSLVVQDRTVPEGRYLFVCELWETLAIKPELRLVGFACSLDGEGMAPEVSSVLVRLLSSVSATNRAGPAEESERLQQRLPMLDEHAHEERQRALESLQERNTTLIARQLASLDTYYRNRLLRVSEELASATDERIRRMKESEHGRIEADYVRRQTSIEARRHADIVSQRIAAGILEVRHGDGL